MPGKVLLFPASSPHLASLKAAITFPQIRPKTSPPKKDCFNISVLHFNISYSLTLEVIMTQYFHHQFDWWWKKATVAMPL
jgi:hypothetical protein